jgi:hypothetical protein
VVRWKSVDGKWSALFWVRWLHEQDGCDSWVLFTLASHLVYLVYMSYKLIEGNITWRPFLFVPLMGLYLVLVGTKIGYRFRDRIKING